MTVNSRGKKTNFGVSPYDTSQNNIQNNLQETKYFYSVVNKFLI